MSRSYTTSNNAAVVGTQSTDEVRAHAPRIVITPSPRSASPTFSHVSDDFDLVDEDEPDAVHL